MAVFLPEKKRCSICRVGVDAGRLRSFPHFLRCSRCGGYFLSSSGVQAEYPERYFSESQGTSRISGLASFLLSLFLWLRLRHIRSLSRNIFSSRVLDYGAGDGQLVATMRQAGIYAVGYDPSPDAAILAARRGIPVFTEVPGGPYHLVLFWHSLEHTDQPAEALAALKPFLASGARLLIAVPNAASWEAKLAGERWFHYDYPFHRVHFTPRAIRMLLEKAGFRVLAFDFFTPEYTVSGLCQTFLNFFLPKNALYSAVSHRRISLSRSKLFLAAGASLVLLVAFSPLLIALFLLQLLFRRTGAMVVTAELI